MSAGSMIHVRTILVASHPGQLSLAIPPWVGAVKTSESWGVNRHTIPCTLKVLPKPHGPADCLCKARLHYSLASGFVVSGGQLQRQRSAPTSGPVWLGNDFTFTLNVNDDDTVD